MCVLKLHTCIFIFRGLPTWEPVSSVFDNNRRPILFSGILRETVFTTPNARKNWRENLEEMKLNEMRRNYIISKIEFLAADEYLKAIF